MNKIKTLFVVSLLLTCMYIPCIAAADNNGGLSAYDAQVIKTMGQANTRDGSAEMGMAADAQAIRSNSRNDLQIARETYRNNKTPENQQMLMDAAKDHLLHLLDRMIDRLEILQERIKFAEENRSRVPDGASETLNRYITKLESYKLKVENADTPDELRSVAQSINQEWRSIRRESLYYAKYLIAAHIELYLEKANNISDRLDVKIGERESEGVDTTDLRQNLDDFNAKIVCVEENYELAKDAVSNNEINPLDVRQYIQNSRRCIVEANHLLREMFKELRSLEGYSSGAVLSNGTGTVVLTGTGTLEASGSGMVWIHGSPDLALSCDNGTLKLQDHAGDMKITVTGNGVKGQSGIWTMYRGFDGTTDITGSDVSVALVGSGIELTVTGTGQAILTGDGTYQVSGSDDSLISSGDWQEPRDGYEVGMDASVFEEAEFSGGEL